MTVVINEMDVVAPEPVPAAAPDAPGHGGPSAAERERRVEQALRERDERARRLRAY
jgi:hypothetical protein